MLGLTAAAAVLTLRSPFLGLGVLVAGMAFHNFLIMGLIKLGSSHLLIRIVQSWKEVLIALLLVIAALRLYRGYRQGAIARLVVLDWIVIAFFALMVLYLVLPSGVLHGHANFQQRIAAFRLAVYMPVLYALGRSFQAPAPHDLAGVAWMVVGAAALVGLFGLYELWFVPTRTWLSWGINDFSAWLGFRYSGPGNLPENFFQTLPSGLYLRRMVSTYLSPLGIAYTGLLVFPIAVVLVDRQRRGTVAAFLASFALMFMIAGLLFSVTRLAIFALAAEGILLAVLIRRPWVTIMAPLLVVAVFAVLAIYPQVGPAVDSNLVAGGPNRGGIIRAGDPSFIEHLKTVEADAKVAARHPLGEGLGSAGSSANRFTSGTSSNPDYAPGESAVLTMFVDTGLVGGAAYLAMYLLGLVQAARALLKAKPGTWESVLPLSALVGGLALVPITLTSDVWGDLSVLFLFWWGVGYSAGQARDAVPVISALRSQYHRLKPAAT